MRLNFFDKKSIAYKLQKLVWQGARKFDKKLRVEDIQIEHPENPEHGDLSSNIAMKIFAQIKIDSGRFKNPLELAEKIIKLLPKPDYLEKVEVAPPGFINFWLSKNWLMEELKRIIREKGKYGSSKIGKGKTIVLEHTSPNIIKILHLGHVRNNVLGMAIGRILKFLGFKVILDCINNDRGFAVMKAVWAYLRFGVKSQKSKISAKGGSASGGKSQKWREALRIWFNNQEKWLTPKEANLKPDHFVDKFYILGVKNEAKYKHEMQEMLRSWEENDPKIWAIWKKLTDWVHQGFSQTYKRLGSYHDKNWYESQLYKEGKKIVLEGVKKGVFKRLADGAILTNLKKFGLPDKIVMRSDGTALYETFDLALTKRKKEEFKAQFYIWDVGPEQSLYLKQLFAMCEQLGIGKRKDFFHLSYGFVYLKGKGKMSSREGTVVSADYLMDELCRRAKKIIETSDQSLRGKITKKEKEEIAEAVGIAGLKYGMLKFSRKTDIYFDIDKSLSLEGDSGPYLQYTYARCKSVLRKARKVQAIPDCPLGPIRDRTSLTPRVNKEEVGILRTIYKFGQVVLEAGENFAPNLVCNFLYDLAQKYNTFYDKWPIIKAPHPKFKAQRLAITAATAQILQNGLSLLGIKSLERM